MGTPRWIFATGLLVGLTAACSTETDLTITAHGESAEGETVPLSNVRLDILPYDIDELYGELEAETQPGPEPSADTIRQLSQRYQDVAVTPYYRFEKVNTQHSVAEGFVADPSRDATFHTLGVEARPIYNIVLKADYTWVSNRANTGRDQLSINLGYAF